MKWHSSALLLDDALAALAGVQDDIHRVMGERTVHLVVLFVAPRHAAQAQRLQRALRELFPGARVVGGSAAGVSAGGEEHEHGDASSLVVAHLPDVALTPIRVPAEAVSSLDDVAADLVRRVCEVDAMTQPCFVLLADPFSVPATQLLAAWDEAYPRAEKLGGLLSGGRRFGDHKLLLDGEVYSSGLVGVALAGDIRMDTVVAQGCRGVGPPLRVTRALGARILTLDGRPALEVLQSVYQMMEPLDKASFRQLPVVGVSLVGPEPSGRRGDFLIREILGLDREAGAIELADSVAVGDCVRFHVRDAGASSSDLQAWMTQVASQTAEAAAGALMFSCVGRGAQLYGRSGHDTAVIQGALDQIPVGGFFCSGELGSLHGKTRLHGYTCAVGVFRPRDWN